VAVHIAPSVLWDQNPRDLATMVDILEEQNRKASR
jgi:hypothetical protein